MVEDIQVHTFDSRLAAMIEGSFAIYAAQLVQRDINLMILLMN